jgi:hypothetical protein
MAFIQMGMMKEHVRGPIKCCETLAADICLQMRAEELVFNENFHPVEVTTATRGREDTLGGNSTARVLGLPCEHTPVMLLREMLRMIVDDIADTHDGAWEPGDHQHEDLIIAEYTRAIVGSSTHLCVDWISGNRATSDYYMYWSSAKLEGDRVQEEHPVQPCIGELQSMNSPPPDFIHEMEDYYNDHFVGKVTMKSY